ncbi:DEAD/DEAH box helicase family protein [Nibribacter ruber]|uniref:DEAD/DEAH box helicase family protein n=1 Tax=Nibribacter ruber TaxID=2698458 RepID=A0A6P1P4E3_9BACT|nr:DEAD/DEAH box helicase [Nibribacter ruber]QHL89196.1 DEAD/DEAH box helicase family protein [Nibribacter ruber]
MTTSPAPQAHNLLGSPSATEFVIDHVDLGAITFDWLEAHCAERLLPEARGYADIHPLSIQVDFGSFVNPFSSIVFQPVVVRQLGGSLRLDCACAAPKNKMCTHQVQVLQCVLYREEVRVFFDPTLRRQKMQKAAAPYGLEHEPDLDTFFELEYSNKNLHIEPRRKELFPIHTFTSAFIAEELSPSGPRLPAAPLAVDGVKPIVVIGKHRFYNNLHLDLMEAPLTREGKIKNPLKALAPFDFLWQTQDPEELKFYSGISKFQGNYNTTRTPADLAALQALLKNPLRLEFYWHNPEKSVNVTASALSPVQVKALPVDVQLTVHLQNDFYEVSGHLQLEGQAYAFSDLDVQFNYFLHLKNTLYLVEREEMLRVIEFFKKHHHQLVLHSSKFEEFRTQVLAPLEDQINITYSFLRPATAQQVKEQGFDQPAQKLLYLSESTPYVLLTPAMKYGANEVPVLSRKQIYATDAQGRAFTLNREEAAELALTRAILEEHPDLENQISQTSFYLHKDQFLDQDWFLEAFDAWRAQGITILGFDQLKSQKFSPFKGTLSISMESGLDWFDTHIDLLYGKQKASLKQVAKAVKNKTRYVQLDDGTLGILPQEWMDRLARYFRWADVVEEQLRTPKIHFAHVAELYEDEVLPNEIKKELATLQKKMQPTAKLPQIPAPATLQATLRPYQQQGLNWLHQLDDLNFGGCLADDMGLGKTVQVIAFLLVLKEKRAAGPHLVVVPTSLLFNWQQELARFAPSLKVHTFYGAVRGRKEFDLVDIVLTSYGTLLSEIKALKEITFHYIFLDESQAIKNPESQRYKAARLLKARNRIVLTGTPVENNTIDLYGQLSFACPGLLGDKRYFRDHYATPIDKFKETKRAAELQKKIQPFLLRRTKEQVAAELPEKTEMVIYCEMGLEQRQIYESHAKDVRDFLLAQQEDDLPKSRMHVLKGLTKLRQICNSPALLPDEASYGESSAKMEALLEQIENKAPYHKILVFSQFVSMLDLIRPELEKRGIAYEYLTGQTTQRGQKVESFQTKPDVRVFLISLKAGGTGLNLTSADYVYLVDPWWNPAVENQAIDRAHRIGQHQNVVAVRLICPDTIEEKIMTLQASKKELAGNLVKTDSSVLSTFSRQDLLHLVS